MLIKPPTPPGMALPAASRMDFMDCFDKSSQHSRFEEGGGECLGTVGTFGGGKGFRIGGVATGGKIGGRGFGGGGIEGRLGGGGGGITGVGGLQSNTQWPTLALPGNIPGGHLKPQSRLYAFPVPGSVQKQISRSFTYRAVQFGGAFGGGIEGGIVRKPNSSIRVVA